MERTINGWYYLHSNGDLIFKQTQPEIEPGGFVRRVWPIDTTDRVHAWVLCIESLAMGANRERIDELVAKWGLTDADAQQFLVHFTTKQDEPLLKLDRDGDQWCATFSDFVNLQESRAGFGKTALDAFADLVRPNAKNLEGKVAAMQ
jgi:hypothetical protein